MILHTNAKVLGWRLVQTCVCVLSRFRPFWLFETPMDCSPPGSSLHGTLQARIPEWVAKPSSREDLSNPGIKPRSPMPTLLCFALLCFADIASFTDWRKSIYCCHFSNSICSLHVCHILVIFAIFPFFYLYNYIYYHVYSSWWSVISDLWCYYYDSLKAQMMVNIF